MCYDELMNDLEDFDEYMNSQREREKNRMTKIEIIELKNGKAKKYTFADGKIFIRKNGAVFRKTDRIPPKSQLLSYYLGDNILVFGYVYNFKIDLKSLYYIDCSKEDTEDVEIIRDMTSLFSDINTAFFRKYINRNEKSNRLLTRLHVNEMKRVFKTLENIESY